MGDKPKKRGREPKIRGPVRFGLTMFVVFSLGLLIGYFVTNQLHNDLPAGDVTLTSARVNTEDDAEPTADEPKGTEEEMEAVPEPVKEAEHDLTTASEESLAASGIQIISPPKDGWLTVYVQRGQTLTELLHTTGNSIKRIPEVAAKNELDDPDFIRTGQTLAIPVSDLRFGDIESQ